MKIVRKMIDLLGSSFRDFYRYMARFHHQSVVHFSGEDGNFHPVWVENIPPARIRSGIFSGMPVGKKQPGLSAERRSGQSLRILRSLLLAAALNAGYLEAGEASILVITIVRFPCQFRFHGQRTGSG